MDTQQFAEWLSKIQNIVVEKIDKDRVFFECLDEKLVLKITQTAERSDNFLSINTKNDRFIVFCLHKHNFDRFIEVWNGDDKKTKLTKEGIPDLSLVTCKQMASELKNRENLTYAFIWMENEATENFSFEASGNPTILCGLLSRGLNMAIKWADKVTQYEDQEEDLS